MALSKEKKREVVSQYEQWLTESKAVVLTEYLGLDMPAIDALRAKAREAGGEFHIIKNTLAKRALAAANLEVPPEHLLGSTALGVAFEDAPALAKVIVDFSKENEAIKVKIGFLGGELMTAEQIVALAQLPPLPVVRGQLLGVIMAPASKLSRLLAEPGRQLAQVIKAYADGEPASAAA